MEKYIVINTDNKAKKVFKAKIILKKKIPIKLVDKKNS